MSPTEAGAHPAARAAAIADWRAAPDDVAPVVLLLGGFLTSPPFYRPLRARLLRRGAVAVVVGNVWTTDWLLVPAIGLGRILDRSAAALRRAVATSAESDRSRGAPLLVIGHSAGGMVARLLTAERPLEGRAHARAEDMGAIVTLGTPHVVGSTHQLGRRVGRAAARFANEAVPGARFAPEVGYLAVAASSIVGDPAGTGRERVAARLYRGLLGPRSSPLDGDGLVPRESALLDGARTVVLPDVVHGQANGQPWYGTERGLDAWWPVALQVWHEALRHRAAASSSIVSSLVTSTAEDDQTRSVTAARAAAGRR